MIRRHTWHGDDEEGINWKQISEGRRYGGWEVRYPDGEGGKMLTSGTRSAQKSEGGRIWLEDSYRRFLLMGFYLIDPIPK